MKDLNRIKIIFDPKEKRHYIYGWNSFFYPHDPSKIHEGWECLFPIEDVKDWEEILLRIIKDTLENDNESGGNA